MCIRLNNVRTLRNILATLIETAVGTVAEIQFDADFNGDVMCTSDIPSTSKWYQDEEACSSPG